MSIAVEFGEKAAADRYRDEHDEYICPIDDDARKKTVHFVSDAPEWLIEQARAEADEGKAARAATVGQAELTDTEKDRIDFSADRANIPWAQSIKALAEQHNVSDWTSYVDETLTVDEHRDVMERAGREGGGARDEGDQRAAQREKRAAARQQDEECDHARNHCVNGDPDACEFLKDACGFDQSEVSQFLAADVERADPDEITGEAAGALKRAWGGYQGATADLAEAIEEVERDWKDAQQAAEAINSIREAHGQEPIHFEKLEGANAKLQDLQRTAAADCHECHADHSEHDHPTDYERVLELDDQQTLEGDRADDQARLAGGERGEQEAETIEAVEENPGGIMADERSDTDEEQQTEQATPDAFQVAEGGQETLQ